MDIKTANSILLDWFDSNDSYTHETDFKRLNWTLLAPEASQNDNEREVAILAALKLMTEEEFLFDVIIDAISKTKTQKDILDSDALKKDSNVPIYVSKSTADKVSKVVNSILPMLDINITEKSSPKALGEADILVLLQGFGILTGKLEELENKDKK